MSASDEEPADGASCSLTVCDGRDARLTGMVRTDAASVSISGVLQVLPVPAGRVEPAPFVNFRGPVAIGGRSTTVDVLFIDNLMYRASIGTTGALLHLTCEPPD